MVHKRDHYASRLVMLPFFFFFFSIPQGQVRVASAKGVGLLTDNDTDRVQVVEQIVGQAFRVQTSSQGIGSGSKTVVIDLPDRGEGKDGAGLEGTLHVVDERIIVWIRLSAPCGLSHTGLAKVPEAGSADLLQAAVREDVAKNLEDVAQIRPSGRLLDQARV